MGVRERVYKDQANKMFMPMNVEGGTWNEHFITTPKLVTIGGIIATAVGIGMWLSSRYAPLKSYFIFYIGWAVISAYLMRFVVFQEKYYYQMYLKLKEHQTTTPSIFWDIASMRETDEGAIMTYTDGKVGVMIRLDRDTITGKNKEFKDLHFDAISEFYKEIMEHKYKFVQANVMEPAGKDPRLHELEKLIYTGDNENLRELMEMQIGHIKNITHSTLYETDYVLIYTEDLQRVDMIINDVIECVYRILDGAYIGYRILDSREIIEYVKDYHGVKYFNATDATLTMFQQRNTKQTKPFEIKRVVFEDTDYQDIGSRELNRIMGMTYEVLNDNKDINSFEIKKAIYSEDSKIQGIDFRSLVGNEETDNKKKKGRKRERTVEIEQEKPEDIHLEVQEEIGEEQQELNNQLYNDFDIEFEELDIMDDEDIDF